MTLTEAEKAADAAAQDRALSVDCPVCRVKAGERCRNTVTGQPCNLVHGGRVATWENQAPAIGAKRLCPDCGHPQHYTGTEHGWAHDALIDTWECADPRKAGA